MDQHIDILNVINGKYSLNELKNKARLLGLTVLIETKKNYKKAILEWMEENNYRETALDPFNSMSPEILWEIANQISDEDILNLCQTNLRFYKLCNDILFWSRRALDKGYISTLEFFGTVEKWPKNNYGERTPQERYLQLLSTKDCVPGSEKYIGDWKHLCPKRASKKGDMKHVKYFLEKGGDISSAFNGAVEGGHIDIVKYLIENQKKKIRTSCIITGLEKAAKGGHIEIVKYLVEKDIVDSNIALYTTINSGNIEIVKYLIEEQDADETYDAFIIAVKLGYTEIVRYLIAKGNVLFDDEVLEYLNTLEIPGVNEETIKYLNTLEID